MGHDRSWRVQNDVNISFIYEIIQNEMKLKYKSKCYWETRVSSSRHNQNYYKPRPVENLNIEGMDEDGQVEGGTVWESNERDILIEAVIIH